MITRVPANEDERIATLHNYGILDTPPEPVFDELCELAAQICKTPISLISLVDSNRLWFKARLGIPDSQTPRHESFCAHCILEPSQVLVVDDAAADPRFANSALVKGDMAVRFYAGAPLLAKDGGVLGALCVMDRKPRVLLPDEVTALRILARQVATQIELRHALGHRDKEAEQLSLRAQALNACSEGIAITDARLPDNPLILVNPSFERITGYSAAEVLGKNCRLLQNDDRDQPDLLRLRSALKQERSCRVVLRNYRKDGRPFWNELSISPVRNEAGAVTHFIGVQSDITARKESEDSMRQRDAILEGVSLAAETLLNATDHQAALPDVLEQLGRAIHADVLMLWQEEKRPDRVPLLHLRNLWEGATLARPGLDVPQAIEWDESTGFPSATELRAGRAVQGSPAEHSPAERRVLEGLGVASFLSLPVLTGQGGLWGVIAFGFHREGVRWGFVEIEALRSATRMIGAVLHDRETGAALRASDERFRTVVANLTEVVFQTDAAGLWTFLNPAWTQITGYGIDESLNTSFLQFVHPDDRERSHQLFLTLIERKNDHCRHELRYLTKAGGFKWIEVYAKLALDPRGNIVGTAGTLNDITDRRLVAESLQKQRAAIEAAIDGVAILDGQGRFTYLNATHLEMFGYHMPEDLLGKTWQELYHPAEVAQIETEALPSLRQQGRWRGSVMGRRRDGQSFAQEVSLTQIEGGGLVCVCRDISDRLRADERIRSSLREKEVMLKEIHHRVKNNMQIVSSLLNLQLEHLEDEKARIQFMDSQNRIASMALVHEKLYQSADLAHIDFTDYLRDLTDNLVGALGAAARNIVFELKSGDLHLAVDTAIPCGLIINELVSNAYKHGFPDGRTGRVSLSVERLPDERLRLEVLDTGVGLAPGFDPRQTHSLGIELVNTLVQQLRGTLELDRVGGTRFIIHLTEATRRNSPTS